MVAALNLQRQLSNPAVTSFTNGIRLSAGSRNSSQTDSPDSRPIFLAGDGTCCRPTALLAAGRLHARMGVRGKGGSPLPRLGTQNPGARSALPISIAYVLPKING